MFNEQCLYSWLISRRLNFSVFFHSDNDYETFIQTSKPNKIITETKADHRSTSL